MKSFRFVFQLIQKRVCFILCYDYLLVDVRKSCVCYFKIIVLFDVNFLD